jgi:hypothetical protein
MNYCVFSPTEDPALRWMRDVAANHVEMARDHKRKVLQIRSELLVQFVVHSPTFRAARGPDSSAVWSDSGGNRRWDATRRGC